MSYENGMVPGPTHVRDCCMRKYMIQYGSSDLEHEFVELYEDTQQKLSQILGCPTKDVVIQSGEAMVCLWGALKSVIKSGDRVLSVATGLFGYGIGDMAKSCGADVRVVGCEYDEGLSPDMLARISEELKTFQPSLVTVVHCETPSGVLNPLAELGAMVHSAGALLYVDFVSSGGACVVDVANWHIDLGLLGTQKALSLPPDLGIVTVSERAWERIDVIKYQGYDALLPYKNAVSDSYFPYTPNWRAVAALNCGASHIVDSGLAQVYEKHKALAARCRRRLRGMGLKLFVKDEAFASPSVTSVYVPDDWTWSSLDSELRKRGVVFGGNFGKLKDRVFRIGHMGTQCEENLLDYCLEALAEVLTGKK